MAVETEVLREAAPRASNGHAPRVRLHEEILPPALDATNPIALRNARRALVVLAAGMILLQLVAAPIGHRLNSIARSGTDAYSEWQQYASNPVPDVLVIGASPARTDIDEISLSAELSAAAGHEVTVEKLGFAGQTPRFLDALVYRIMKRQPHPSLIVITLVGPEFNDGCRACTASITGGLWDISDLTDPEFVRLALQLDPNPALLATGWMVPAFAYYPSVIAVQCLAYDHGRAAAIALTGRVPRQLQNPTFCEGTAAYKWSRQAMMTPTDYESSIDQYRNFMTDYRVSAESISSAERIVQRSRAAGTRVVLLQAPLGPGLQTLFSAEIGAYDQQLNSLATRLNTPVVDLSAAVPDDPALWIDAVHLDQAGAVYAAPQLARELRPYLQTTTP
jgi:hypothetical protein